MQCENCLCVYEKDGECTIDEISINDMGMCEDCIVVTPDDKTLDKLKKNWKKRMDKDYGDEW